MYTVKAYQKNKLNDAEMSLSSRKVEKTELNFQSYGKALPELMAAKRAAAADVIKLIINEEANTRSNWNVLKHIVCILAKHIRQFL